MREFLDGLYSPEAGCAEARQFPIGELIDVADGETVLHFTYRYLEARSLPPTDEEVHSVTAAIARYKGPPVVSWATLESFLAGLMVSDPA